MSIATEITRIQQAKADIKTAIEAKGVTVPSSATIDTYDDYVSQISDGGGGSSSADTVLKEIIDRSITSINIPSGVTTIGNNAFKSCTSLTSVTIGDSVTSISAYAFESCTSLPSINIPSGVTSIGTNAFYYCTSLTSVTISDSVTSIGINAFYYCSSLTSIDIPSGVTSIGQNAFKYCTSLTSVTCLATTPPTLGSSAFNNTNNCPIYVPSESVSTYQTTGNWASLASRIQAIPNS